jgi:replicative DNA helicase
MNVVHFNDYHQPHNQEAEQALLGSLLVKNSTYDVIAGMITQDHFYVPVHGRIYQAIIKELEKGGSVTPILIAPMFSQDSELKAMGGGAYISELAANVISTINAKDYAEAIYNNYIRRSLISMSKDWKAECEDQSKDIHSIMDNAERDLLSVRDTNVSDTLNTAEESMDMALDWISTVRSSDYQPLSTGLKSIDEKINGFLPGRLYVLAARPGMGKTALALNMAEEVSKLGPVLFFSLEMPKQELSMRLAARHTGITVQKQLRAKELSANEVATLRDSVRNKNILIDDRGGLTIEQIVVRARQIVRLRSARMVVIDYLGLIKGDPRLNRTHQIEHITTTCKALAKELDIPVLLLSQLNRGVEKQDNKRPTLSDLRDSGAIEQDADVVMFIYREEYYLERLKFDMSIKKSGPRKQHETEDALANLDNVKGLAEIIFGKNRQGTAGTVNVKFNGMKQYFYEEQ